LNSRLIEKFGKYTEDIYSLTNEECIDYIINNPILNQLRVMNSITIDNKIKSNMLTVMSAHVASSLYESVKRYQGSFNREP